jgi:hypothetical protein
MSKSKTSEVRAFTGKPKRRRPGVHSKTKTSKAKASNNYKKPYVGQGR